MEAISCKLGVSISTLKNWEQGRREPDGPAKALLKIASKNPEAVPEAVMDALHS
jgi:putative transcriptional regulator